MKRSLIGVAAALAMAASAQAADPQRPGGQAAEVPSPSATVKQMKDNMVELNTKLDRIAAADNAEERQRLLLDYMQTMRENMMLGMQMAAGDQGCPMYGMMGNYGAGMGMMGPGGPMMGPGMMGPGMMMGQGWNNAYPEAMTHRMQQMERRLDMMQMMLERQSGMPRGGTTEKR